MACSSCLVPTPVVSNWGAIEVQSLPFLELQVGVFPLIVLASAVVVIAAFQYLFFHTSYGAILRATSDNPEIVQIIGIDPKRVYAYASALAFAAIAIAGLLMAIRSNFDPFIGPARLLTAFEAVIIGGLGSFWGTFLGAIVIGIAQAIGAKIDPSLQILSGHIVFLLILLVRPNGLFPKVTHQ